MADVKFDVGLELGSGVELGGEVDDREDADEGREV